MPIKTTTFAATTTLATSSRPMTPKTTKRSFTVHNTDRAEQLRASQLVNVASEELAWFFLSDETDPAAVTARAMIESWIAMLNTTEQRALALRFDPEPWSEDLQEEGLDGGYVLAVSVASAGRWYAYSRPHQVAHRPASDYLETTVRARGVSAIRGIVQRAEWDYANAVRAYGAVRGRCASVLPRHAA
jgi:hypothetical protein